MQKARCRWLDSKRVAQWAAEAEMVLSSFRGGEWGVSGRLMGG